MCVFSQKEKEVERRCIEKENKEAERGLSFFLSCDCLFANAHLYCINAVYVKRGEELLRRNHSYEF